MHQPMVEGEHPAAVLAVLSRPGLEDFLACESGASDQNPVHSTSGRTTPMMTKLGIVCVMSPIQVL